jgi:hypothetical protein
MPHIGRIGRTLGFAAAGTLVAACSDSHAPRTAPGTNGLTASARRRGHGAANVQAVTYRPRSEAWASSSTARTQPSTTAPPTRSRCHCSRRAHTLTAIPWFGASGEGGSALTLTFTIK